MRLGHSRGGTFAVGSVHEAEIPASVAVTAIGEVLNYATDPRAGLDALGAVASRVHDALVPGGIFVFDVSTPGRNFGLDVRHVFHDHDTWMLGMHATETAGTLDRRIVVLIRDGDGRYRRVDEHHVLVLYEVADVVAELERTGFTVAVYGSYSEVVAEATAATQATASRPAREDAPMHDADAVGAPGVPAIPPVVRNKAIAAGADAWLDAVPELIAELEREWCIAVGRTFTDATEALVAAATLENGTPAVLKLIVPRSGGAARNEITVLRLVDGDGCARLLRDDVERGALLVERLGRSLSELTLPIDARLEILVSTARRVWRPAPESGLPTGADKGRWLMEMVVERWEALDRPCSERAVEHALACAARRIAAHDDERSVLVHGDVHQWNALEAEQGFKLVDPDGLLAEAEYDLGILMREDPLELMDGDPRERARRLATRTGLDATAIWEWGAIERVSTGLLCTEVDLQPVGAEMLAAADRISRMS